MAEDKLKIEISFEEDNVLFRCLCESGDLQEKHGGKLSDYFPEVKKTMSNEELRLMSSAGIKVQMNTAMNDAGLNNAERSAIINIHKQADIIYSKGEKTYPMCLLEVTSTAKGLTSKDVNNYLKACDKLQALAASKEKSTPPPPSAKKVKKYDF